MEYDPAERDINFQLGWRSRIKGERHFNRKQGVHWKWRVFYVLRTYVPRYEFDENSKITHRREDMLLTHRNALCATFQEAVEFAKITSQQNKR